MPTQDIYAMYETIIGCAKNKYESEQLYKNTASTAPLTPIHRQ